MLALLSQQTFFSVGVVNVAGKRITIVVFDKISSTMDISAHWSTSLLNDHDSYWFSAVQQTQGQGLEGWPSPPGNVYITGFAKLAEGNLETLRSLCSRAGCTLLENYGIEGATIGHAGASIIVGSKPIGGSLVVANELAGKFAAQLGIGINVLAKTISTSTFMNEVRPGVYNFAEIAVELIGLIVE